LWAKSLFVNVCKCLILLFDWKVSPFEDNIEFVSEASPPPRCDRRVILSDLCMWVSGCAKPHFFLFCKTPPLLRWFFCYVRSRRGLIVPSRTVFIFEAPPPLFAYEVGSWCDTQLHARNMFDCEAPPPLFAFLEEWGTQHALGTMFRRAFVGDLRYFCSLR